MTKITNDIFYIGVDDDDLDYLIDYTYRQRLLGINNTMDEFIESFHEFIEDYDN